MNHINRLYHLFIFLFGFAISIFAEDVVFQASAPKQVVVGKPFQLVYSVNQRARDLRAPSISDFDVLAGPYTSQSSSTSFVNGKRTSSFQLTYTYTLMASREGSFTIPGATITVDGEQYQSNGVRIQVLPADETSPTPSSGRGEQEKTSSPEVKSGNSGNIFVRTIVSKTRVREQEALCLTYKLYFAGVDVAQLTNNTKLPDFTGFLRQEIDLGERQAELEHYDGRNYQTYTLYQTLLYPQHSGEIKIDPASFEAVLRVQTRQQVRSIFDDFFGTYTNVTRALTAPGVTISASALPAGKPSGFSGGVGSFSLSSDISTTDLKANEAVTLRLTVKGSGNMKLLKTPAVDWPEGFEAYDPKASNDFRTTASGVSGTKTIEYLAIPRAGGDYTIPAVQFSYFDTNEGAYKTLTSPEYTLHVQRGANEAAASVQDYSGVSAAQKEDIRQLGTDIRYIHTAPLQSTTYNLPLITYPRLALAYLIPTLLALVVLMLLRRQIRENSDLTRVRYKKANKVAQRRLKNARKLLSGDDKSAFYEEIERAVASYLSDRLSIPTADLTKEKIAEVLSSKKVPDALIDETRNVLSDAEFARYAPSVAGDMQKMYDAATTLIDHLEEQKL